MLTRVGDSSLIDAINNEWPPVGWAAGPATYMAGESMLTLSRALGARGLSEQTRSGEGVVASAHAMALPPSPALGPASIGSC